MLYFRLSSVKLFQIVVVCLFIFARAFVLDRLSSIRLLCDTRGMLIILFLIRFLNSRCRLQRRQRIFIDVSNVGLLLRNHMLAYLDVCPFQLQSCRLYLVPVCRIGPSLHFVDNLLKLLCCFVEIKQGFCEHFLKLLF